MSNPDDELGKVRAAAEEAVAQGKDIQAEVREITLHALSEGRLEVPRIRAVIGAVMEGGQRAASRQGAQAGEVLREVIGGLSQATLKTAEALSLAVQEAAGRVGQFSGTEARRTVDDLTSLEKMFVETVTHAVKSGGGLAKGMLDDLLAHVMRGGSGIGQHARQSAERLGPQLQKMGAETRQTSSELAEQISQIARGILAGVGETLQHVAESKKPGPPK